MEIIPVKTTAQILAVEKLAWEIMPEHYGPYIPMDQIIFFLKKYQTGEKIQEQIRDGYEYYLMNQDQIEMAYIGLQMEKRSLVLSKLYVLKDFRNKGTGQEAMKFIESRAFALNADSIELNVNRENSRAIKFYERYDFQITAPLVQKYENGHSVEEYRMTKALF